MRIVEIHNDEAVAFVERQNELFHRRIAAPLDQRARMVSAGRVGMEKWGREDDVPGEK